MIRYAVPLTEIESAINDYQQTWLQRAATRTAQFIAAQHYDESSSIWSEIKPIFMAVQSNKCVFCERQFESVEYGSIEHDLEHFRPKSSVTAWPRSSDGLNYSFNTGTESERGYYWLAYTLSNYATACKVCNSSLKSNCFPVAGTRALAPSDALVDEQAYLCYPIGTEDDDPEQLVNFQGIIAVPAAQDGHKRRRGQIIIDFFRLNERELLLHERARLIAELGTALHEIAQHIDPAVNQQIVTRLLSGELPHTGCCRAYHTLWQHDRPLALQYRQFCREVRAGLADVRGGPL